MFDIVYITNKEADSLKGKKLCDNWYFNPQQDIDGNWFVSRIERDESNLEWIKKKTSIEVDGSILFEQQTFNAKRNKRFRRTVTSLGPGTHMELYELIAQFGDAVLSTALLGYWVVMLRSDLKDEKEKVEKLNEYIRLSDKENIQTLSEFGKFLESLIANVDSIKGELAKEIAHSAETVKNKIDNLRTIIESKNESR